MSFETAEADRRISQVVQLGTIVAVRGEASRASVRIGDVETGELPVTQLRMGGIRFYAMPSPGEQVLVFAPSGDLARAIVGPSIEAMNAPGDGDPAHAVLDMGSGELRITGDIVLTGKLIASDDVVAQGVSLVGHLHEGVTPGSGLTKEPVK